MRPKRIVFACIQNAGRSQIAAGFFNAHADPHEARAVSAGTRPAAHVHPEVVAAMRERGVELAGAVPRLLTTELVTGATLLVTLGCGEQCPPLGDVPHVDWPTRDPKGQALDVVRVIRDELEARVLELLALRGWGRRGPQRPAPEAAARGAGLAKGSPSTARSSSGSES
jgi:arsenate reductase